MQGYISSIRALSLSCISIYADAYTVYSSQNSSQNKLKNLVASGCLDNKPVNQYIIDRWQ